MSRGTHRRDRPLSSPRSFPRFPPENEVRSGLSAGGKWIRTIGPPPEIVVDPSGRAEIIGRCAGVVRGDREFEVAAVQGSLSTSSQSECSTDLGLIAGTWHRHLFLTRDRWFES